MNRAESGTMEMPELKGRECRPTVNFLTSLIFLIERWS